jgi:transketolase
MAMAQRLDKMSDAFVYCVMGDGEIQEGQVWEAALSAPMHRLDRLIAFVDWNKGQIDGLTKDVMNVEPIGEKFRAFGWNVLEIDGHDMSAILHAIEQAKTNAKNKSGKPTMIVAETVKGKGVSFMEKAGVSWHGVSPTREQLKAAVEEINSKRTGAK